MTNYTTLHGLQVATSLRSFIEEEVLPGTTIDADIFWSGYSELIQELAPVNRSLLAERDRLQLELDIWHKANPGPVVDMPVYRAFLSSIGYLQPQSMEVKASTSNVDSEISQQAGPQLVVPAMNARYALNAANARWGSLYDALYGSDVIASDHGAEAGAQYNPIRGAKVVAFAKAFLDEALPLSSGSHAGGRAGLKKPHQSSGSEEQTRSATGNSTIRWGTFYRLQFYIKITTNNNYYQK